MHRRRFITFTLTVPVWSCWLGAAPTATMIALSQTFWSVGEDGQCSTRAR
jgi:capsid protein